MCYRFNIFARESDLLDKEYSDFFFNTLIWTTMLVNIFGINIDHSFIISCVKYMAMWYMECDYNSISDNQYDKQRHCSNMINLFNDIMILMCIYQVQLMDWYTVCRSIELWMKSVIETTGVQLINKQYHRAGDLINILANKGEQNMFLHPMTRQPLYELLPAFKKFKWSLTLPHTTLMKQPI